jgi:EAL domain-containing protein (putative c-di-GMP-specific phosphodiesterase class I)
MRGREGRVMDVWLDATDAGAAAASPLDVAIAEADRATLSMVREALRRRRVTLAYQPVVMGRDLSRVAFHEGLVRILDETGRIIPARDFMGAVEMTEIGRLIDCASLELGLAALAREPALRLSVNMSARSIGFARWQDVLQRGLSTDPTVGERLILEITESSAILMPEIVTSFMSRVQRLGISFALDDFGAGYTAFRFFRDFMFDMVKIDGQFIRDVAFDPDNQVLVQALILVARQFDMFLVAEAVETEADADWLRDQGVDCLQGYLFGPPTSAPDWQRDGIRHRA